ncbi:MAG: flagellar basal body P-ring protein FlgI, partial [Bdellovibrionales bacterium]|nr:flagellar basal body P-ring protein FlgI [Bdellovibrionales bacterium]
KVAISHGDLSIKVGSGSAKGKEEEKVMVIDETASVGDLVKILNRMAVSPKDLITILQSIKSAGALQGDLEIL